MISTFEPLRKWIGILLITLMAQAQFLSFSFLVYKSIAPKKFIEQFCENIDKPILKCDGKCFLKKQEQIKASFKEENNPEIVSFSTIALVHEYFALFDEPNPIILKAFGEILSHNLNTYNPLIFHPPRFV